jgi:hypothetical protein
LGQYDIVKQVKKSNFAKMESWCVKFQPSGIYKTNVWCA